MTYTRKDLLALPERDWNKESTYHSIALVPTGKKHSDSGYHLIAIVGYNDKAEPCEIAAYCDDVCYSFEGVIPAPYRGMLALRTDMYYPSGITHIWSSYYQFKIGYCYSSTDVCLVPKEKESN